MPSGGPMRSIAGSTGIRPGPMTLRQRHGPHGPRCPVPPRGRADARRRRRGRAQVRGGDFLTPTPALMQGIARVLCGDPDGGDACLEDAVSVGEQVGSTDDVVIALCEQSLLAMARSEWDRAEILAEKARTVLRKAGIEESFATPLICAVRAARGHAPGRCPGGAPGTRQCPAPAAFADLRAPPLRRPGPDRAGSRPPRARRPGRCQDAHA